MTGPNAGMQGRQSLLEQLDWEAVLRELPRWQAVEPAARTALLEAPSLTQPVSLAKTAQHGAALIEAGLLQPPATGRTRTAINPEVLPLLRLLREWNRVRVLTDPRRDGYDRYTQRMLSTVPLYKPATSYSYYDYRVSTYERVCSRGWLEEFLKQDAAEWERQWHAGIKMFLQVPEKGAAAQALLRFLRAQEAPVPLTVLATGDIPKVPQALRAPALAALCRYFLVFGEVRARDMEPVVWVWPYLSVAPFPADRALPAVEPAGPTFALPYLMEDVVTLLVTASGEPLRLRTDQALYVKVYDALMEALVPLPGWVVPALGAKGGLRLEEALTVAEMLGFLRMEGKTGGELRLHMTAEGGRWLAASPGERLRELIQGLRGANLLVRLGESFDSWERREPSPMQDGLLTCFRHGDGQRFQAWADFLEWQGRASNPLLDIQLKGKVNDLYRYVGSHYYRLSGLGPGELERLWKQLLHQFFTDRLVPLGGAELGQTVEGTLCFRLTDVGRFLVGVTNTFTMAAPASVGGVVVQPNFDVVLMQPSPIAEATLSRFAERVGRGVGTLFRITKASVMEAAARRLTADEVVTTLRGMTDRPLPANVEREIRGWISSARHVTVREMLAIDCGDAETATRAMATLGDKVARLNDSLLEVKDAKERAALLRKLRAMGIFT